MSDEIPTMIPKSRPMIVLGRHNLWRPQDTFENLLEKKNDYPLFLFGYWPSCFQVHCPIAPGDLNLWFFDGDLQSKLIHTLVLTYWYPQIHMTFHSCLVVKTEKVTNQITMLATQSKEDPMENDEG